MPQLPLRVLLVLFFFAPLQVYAQPGQKQLKRLDALLNQYHEVRQLNGVVLVAQGDDVLYEKGFGEANMEWGLPNTPDTRFRIGSITKQFTAALILQLVEAGQLSLEGHITDYLPDYPPAQGDRVTIHQLLTHTSGIPSYTGLPNFVSELMHTPYEPDSLLNVFSGLPLEFEPGTDYRYNNSGYFLLGVIAEHATGQPYDQLLRERLLDPLGLDDSGYDHFGEIIERRAAGYVKAGGGYENAPYLDTGLPYAAGMMYATARDLHAWTRALHRGAPFAQAATLEQMTTPYMQDYGYGLNIAEVSFGDYKTRAIRHGGGINGFASFLAYFPETEHTIVVLDNTAGAVGSVVEAVGRVLFDQPTSAPRQSIADVLAAMIETDGVAAATARYRILRRDQPDTYDFAEQALNNLGYYYLQRGEVETAIEVFKLNVEAYPEAFNTYDSLGEAYLAAGDRERAISNYQKALELNPGSGSARAALERLGVEVPEPSVVVPVEVLDAYVGRYELQPGFVIAVTREGDQLFAQATGQPRFEIFASSPNEFYLKVVDAQLTFHREEDGGAVKQITLHQNGRDIPAKRIE